MPLSIEQLASPQQSIILTHLVKDAANKGYKVYGMLDGYITRTGGGQYPDASRGDTHGHYCSVTMCRETGVYYLSDDLQPESVVVLGKEVNNDWPKPYISFYRMKSFNERIEHRSSLSVLTPLKPKSKCIPSVRIAESSAHKFFHRSQK